MLQPIQDILVTTFGGPPAQPGGVRGFGTVGAVMPTALADIGTTPAFWNQVSGSVNDDTCKYMCVCVLLLL